LVQIKNGKLPGLEDRVNYFEYAKFAQKPEFLTFSNIASRAGESINHTTHTHAIISF